MALTLHGYLTDFRTVKIIVACKYADIDINIDESKISQVLSQCPQAKLPVLETNQGFVFQSNAILRYIGKFRSDSELYGRTNFEMSKIDQWLDYCWNEIEVPSGVLINRPALSKSLPHFEQCEARAITDLNKSLAILDRHLGDKAYLVGDKISIADISSITAIHSLYLSSYPDSEKKKFVNLDRWMSTCLNQPNFSPVKSNSGKLSVSSSKGSSTTPCSQSKGNGKSTNVTLFDRKRLRVKELLSEGSKLIGKEVVVKGWVKTLREAGAGAFAFVELNDGSCFTGIQAIVSKQDTKGFQEVIDSGGAGASLSVTGTVVKSQGKGQEIEVQALEVIVLGVVKDSATYPMSKKRHTLEHLRTHAHLRPRSNIHGAAMRIRHSMAFAIHRFFHELGFLYLHTPLLTAADCEGAGEMFQVSTLLSKFPKGDLPKTKEGQIDYSTDFFHRPAFLTVSGQLNVETHCCGLGDCYTFGPTFRAENSNTTRHLAEFWMVEPEIAFANLKDDMDLAEDMLKYLTNFALQECKEDLEFFDKNVEKGLIQRLENTVKDSFVRLSYTKAIELLTDPIHLKKGKFQVKPKWGDDLGSEHERYITESVYKKPVIIYDYPKEIKAFYMRLNDDGKTVAACDVLVPKIGEIIGGSQREDRLETLRKRVVEATGHDPDAYSWYNDLRKYGTIPHAGFGLGFERLIRFVTGIENIRDVIPFPRWPGNVDF